MLLQLQLRSLRGTEIPEPSPELAALMGDPVDAEVVRLDDWSRRDPRKKRVVLTTLAVAASLAVTGEAAASNETLRRQAEGTISGIIRSFSPPAPEAPITTTAATPAPPSEAPKPSSAVVPSPAGKTPAVTAPAAPAPVQNPAAEPSVRERQDLERKHRAPAPGTSEPGLLPPFRPAKESRSAQVLPTRLMRSQGRAVPTFLLTGSQRAQRTPTAERDKVRTGRP